MSFDKIKGKLGFGVMRLKMLDNEIDINEFKCMTDAFISNGFNYFDTAYGYIDGKSELAIKECLSKRYDREKFVLTDKLTYWCFESEEEIVPLFNKQLEKCGVDYFDFYLFHCINKKGYEKHLACNSFEVVRNLKEQGKIKHIGMSFHDTPELLDKILCEQPDIEVVQLQINYLDYDDPTVKSKACYDVAVKHNKKVMIMEPVKGGALVNLPKKAADELKKLGNDSEASYALRFAADFPEVIMVLSGMGNLDMINENMNTFKNLSSFKDEDYKIFDNVRKIIREVKQLPCTKCNYCMDVCPSKIPVSEIFLIYNKYLGAKISKSDTKSELEAYHEKFEKCVKCGKCENNCPQNIKIREAFEKVAKILN